VSPFLPNAAFRQPRGWVMAMDWEDLLFMHWPVDAEALRRHIPAGLELDLHKGQAWIGIVPFRMAGVHPRYLPRLPGLSAFPELNVRTYVIRNGIPGVWFFSLDAANPIAVRGARRFFHLPYFDADMRVAATPTGFRYHSLRTHHNSAPAELQVEWCPTGPSYRAAPGTLDDWLTARYCLYAADDEGGIFRCSIHHKPWRLQSATAIITVNTMTDQIGIQLPEIPPLLHHSEKTEVVTWLPERLS